MSEEEVGPELPDHVDSKVCEEKVGTQEAVVDQTTKEEVMQKEAAHAVELLKEVDLYLSEADCLRIIQEVDADVVEAFAIFGEGGWADRMMNPGTMQKIINTPSMDMNECIQQSQNLRSIASHIRGIAAWYMKFRMELEATPLMVASTSDKIIGLDGKPATQIDSHPQG